MNPWYLAEYNLYALFIMDLTNQSEQEQEIANLRKKIERLEKDKRMLYFAIESTMSKASKAVDELLTFSLDQKDKRVF